MRFMQKIANAMARFMYGRYGHDRLGMVLMIAALVCSALSWIPYLGLFWLLSFVLMFWELFRLFSRNIAARRRENERLTKIINGVKTFFKLRRRMWRERKTHRYFRCKYCRAMLRVPKGKGEVEVGCPRCKGKTKKKT